MKTIIHLETTDEQRAAIHQNLFGSNGMVSRLQLKTIVEEHIDDQARPDSERIEQAETATSTEPANGRDQCISQFVPSRGDEPYLYSAQDPELATHCSAILDGLEFIRQYTWVALERNRE